jgi:NitT/TauT family transport system substrate-binding protein
LAIFAVVSAAAGCFPSTSPPTAPSGLQPPAQPPAQPTAPAPPSNPAALTPVAFGADWLINGPIAPIFVAIDRGYFAEGGISVSVSRGYGSADAVKRAAAGTSDVVLGDIGTAMLLRANEDAAVKVVAPMYSASPATIIFYEDLNIRTPKDLEGKTIADAAGSSPRLLFPAFAALAGFDATRVTWRSVDPAVRNTLMGNGQLEIITAFSFHVAEIERHVQANNPERRIGAMMYRDYGFDMYGNGFIVADRLTQERPDVVRAFVRGAARGLREAYQDPTAAMLITKRFHPEIDIELCVRQLELIKDLIFTDDVMANGLATFQTERLQKTYDVMAQYFGMRRDVPLNEIYTTQFAPDPPIKP